LGKALFAILSSFLDKIAGKARFAKLHIIAQLSKTNSVSRGATRTLLREEA